MSCALLMEALLCIQIKRNFGELSSVFCGGDPRNFIAWIDCNSASYTIEV
jgi:hypothetical protein